MTIIGALPVTLQNGTTADATDVMSDLNKIRNDTNANAAANGANNDITSLSALTTPLSVAQGGTGTALGPGSTLLASGTVSAAATLDIVLTSYTAFRGLRFILSGFLPATDGAQLYMRFSTDGGATYLSSGYNYATAIASDASAVSGAGSGSAAQITMTGSIGSAATEGVNADIEILNQASTAFWPRVMHRSYYIDNVATPGAWFITGGGSHESAIDVDAVRFLFSAGNIAAGNYAVYSIR